MRESLKDYIAASVWLGTAPDATEKGELTEPRYKSIKHELPDISGGHDLILHLGSLGFNRSVGSGLAAIEYSEINHWMNLMGLNLTPWEVETIHHLSAIHANMSIRARNKNCPAPYQIESTEDRKTRITNLMFR